ncbi:MAG TPA: DUF1853 domain-containing protein [Oxalobacteraceae bacterium]|nr:DUF1853 domain-containing protein [Oxalobacteraceae bacterium]
MPQVESFQTRFHRRWNHLNDPHVRALAWLLDAPDLLDPEAPQWRGRIASLANQTDHEVLDWLAALDRDPGELRDYLGIQPGGQEFTRLGRYAEKLMAFYFRHRGVLLAHGVQVRAAKNDTIGEFDFLLRHGDDLVHWEFATKFYLLESGTAGLEAEYFIGPNLADTLGAKMGKILDRQLMLSQHPAAQIHLPQSVASAQALLRGWLFYHEVGPDTARESGVSKEHCRGFWRALAELESVQAERYALLPRLSWLAPAKMAIAASLDRRALQHALSRHFAQDTMPVLVALLESHGDVALETDRGFIVPDDWRHRAGQRIIRA